MGCDKPTAPQPAARAARGKHHSTRAEATAVPQYLPLLLFYSVNSKPQVDKVVSLIGRRKNNTAPATWQAQFQKFLQNFSKPAGWESPRAMQGTFGLLWLAGKAIFGVFWPFGKAERRGNKSPARTAPAQGGNNVDGAAAPIPRFAASSLTAPTISA